MSGICHDMADFPGWFPSPWDGKQKVAFSVALPFTIQNNHFFGW